MEITSGPFKRGYYISGRIRSQVDIEQSRIQGSVCPIRFLMVRRSAPFSWR